MLSASERHRLLVEWNATQTELPTRCLHELFEAQAACRPNAVALIDGEQRLSYGELNARANRLAHHLRRTRRRPRVLVAICLGRSLSTWSSRFLRLSKRAVPTCHSTWTIRANGLPSCSRTRPPVLVTHAGFCERLPAYPGALVTLDGDAATIAACSGYNRTEPSTPG